MLQQYIPTFLAFLEKRQYAPATLRCYRAALRTFARYLSNQVTRPEEVTSPHVRAYVRSCVRRYRLSSGRTPHGRYRHAILQPLRLFFRYLAANGHEIRVLLPRRLDRCAVPRHEDLLREYAHFLREHRGLSPPTITQYLDAAGRLCRHRSDPSPETWDRLTPEDLYQHISLVARRHGPKSLHVVQSGLRSFFRFLRLTGRCSKAIESYLVRYRTYSLAGLPQALPSRELRRLWETLWTDSRLDLEDRAILVLLILYGMRPGEIVRLHLDDIRWRERHLVLRRRKAGRDLVLPLHPVAARALAAYVRDARPRHAPPRLAAAAAHSG